MRVLEIVNHFEGMDVKALWHDLKFSLRHLNDFSRCAIVSDAKFLSLWSTIAEPFLDCQVAYFKPDEIEAARDWLPGLQRPPTTSENRRNTDCFVGTTYFPVGRRHEFSRRA